MRKSIPHLLAIISITLVTAFFMRDMIKPGLPRVHDSNPHISRMIAFHTALEDGQFPPMWAKEVLGGIGSPVMMLNYQLPYFISEGFVRAGLSYFDSYKLSLALSFIISGILMYLALSSRYTPISTWTGALIYTLAPYRFVDIFVRGALGESLAFMFPPLLIWGFSTSSLPLLILGWAGLFLTHPTASALFSAFFLGYILWVGKKEELSKRLKLFFSSYGVALLLSAFNLIPTITLTKHTYYSPVLSDTLLMFPTFSQLIHSSWGYGVSMPGLGDGMSFEIGTIQWLVLIGGAILAWKNRSKELRYILLASTLAILFILPISIPTYNLFNLTNIIDFPWRLLICLVFASAWVGANVISNLKWPISNWVAVAIGVTLIVQTLPIAHTDSYWDKSVSWFARETGDSYGEYAPRTRVTRDSAPFWLRAESVIGEAQVIQEQDLSNWQAYKIEAQIPSVIRINTSYFPGWQVKIDGKLVSIDERQNEESKRSECFVTTRTQTDIDDSGLFACHIMTGKHKLEINYVALPVQRVASVITLAGIGVYSWILLASFYPRTTKPKR